MKQDPTTPLYLVNKDAREDLGYSKGPAQPQHKWADEVMLSKKKRSPTESPLKIWWLDQQRLKSEEKKKEMAKD